MATLPQFVRPNSLAAYAFAAACVAAATLVRLAFGFAGGDLPFASYFPAILLIGLVAGFGPGLFALLASVAIAWLLFFPHGWSGWPSPIEGANLVFFLLAGLFTLWLADHYRRAALKLSEREKEHDFLVRELQHRGRNNLSIVQAIVFHTLRDRKADAATINDRIRALVDTDRLLTSSPDQTAELRDIVAAEIEPHGAGRVTMGGPDVRLVPELARALALIVHELATNAAKYGALSGNGGRVSIAWGRHDRRVNLTWSERGGPPVSPPTRRGFGSEILATLLQRFDGEAKGDFRPEGVEWRISFVPPSQEQRHDLRASPLSAPRAPLSPSPPVAAGR